MYHNLYFDITIAGKSQRQVVCMYM